MKVTMQHTVDLNEVPLEVDKMMRACVTKLRVISNVATTADPMDPKKFAEQIDFIRRKLFDADNQLEECVTIMRGYEQAVSQDKKATVATEDLSTEQEIPYEVEK
jgi:hypothetical protein